MDGKIKAGLAVAVVAIAAIAGYNKISEKLKKDPVITGLQAEFIGEVAPGGKLTKNMFEVKGITESGQLVPIRDFSSETAQAAANGDSCEIELTSQGYTATTIIPITREAVFTQKIGYPNEDDATVTCYSNGDLEFTGNGDITNFSSVLPWSKCEYTHVYIDEALNIENMDGWFAGNEYLVYCSDLPKTVKTIRNTFRNCYSLEQTPDYFQCSNLKIMDYAFSGCVRLKEIDIIPVNVASMRYAFENCSALQTPVNLGKTSNLTDVSGVHKGCSGLREAADIPETVTAMDECYLGCLNIKKAVKFPSNVQSIASAYQGDTALETGATIPESVIDFTNVYNGCSALTGTLEINTDTDAFNGALLGATTNGDKLSISGNCGNLLAIQKNSGNGSITLADPEAAAQQNERMIREQEG